MCRNYHGTGRSLLLVLVFLPLGAAVVFSQAVQQPPNSPSHNGRYLAAQSGLDSSLGIGSADVDQSVALHLSDLDKTRKALQQLPVRRRATADAAAPLRSAIQRDASDASIARQTSAQARSAKQATLDAICETSSRTSTEIIVAQVRKDQQDKDEAKEKMDITAAVSNLELKKDAGWYLAFAALGAAAGAVADKGNWEAVAIGAAGGLALKVGLSLTIHF